MKKPYVIMLDSSACTPQEIIKKYNFEVLPLSISDQNGKVYADGLDINQREMVKMIQEGYNFKTSATPLGILITKIEDLLEEYEKIIFIPIACGISSQYQTAKSLEEDYEGRFFVVKTSQAIAANEWTAIYVNELMKKKINIKEVIQRAEELQSNICTYFSCDIITSLIKSGRTTKIILHIINAFKMFRPIVYLDEKNQSAGFGKNYKSIVPKMINNIYDIFGKKQITKDEVVAAAIYRGECEDEKIVFIKEHLKKAFGLDDKTIIIRDVPSTILSHVREGAYGLSLYTKLKKKKHVEKE